jgi:hypothetical protein
MEDTNVVTLPETKAKPKRVRKPAPKTEAPVAAPVFDRSLEKLSGVNYSDMSFTELLSVTLDQNEQLAIGRKQLQELQAEIGAQAQQLSKNDARMAYIRQTINHAQTSILLQMGKD